MYYSIQCTLTNGETIHTNQPIPSEMSIKQAEAGVATILRGVSTTMMSESESALILYDTVVDSRMVAAVRVHLVRNQTIKKGME